MPFPIFSSREDVETTTSPVRPFPRPEAPGSDSRPGRSALFLLFSGTGRQQGR